MAATPLRDPAPGEGRGKTTPMRAGRIAIGSIASAYQMSNDYRSDERIGKDNPSFTWTTSAEGTMMQGYLKGLIVVALVGVGVLTWVGVKSCRSAKKKPLDWTHLALYPVDAHRAVVFDWAEDKKAKTVVYRISLVDMRRGRGRGRVWTRSLPGEPYWLGRNHCTSVEQGVISTRVRKGKQQYVLGYDLEHGKMLWTSERLPAQDPQGRRLYPFLNFCNLSTKTRSIEAFKKTEQGGAYLLALDRRTGKTLWKKTYKGSINYPGSTVAGQVVVVQVTSGGDDRDRWLYLRQSDGKQVHADSKTASRPPCLGFGQAWFLKQGRILTALDLNRLTTRQVTERFGAKPGSTVSPFFSLVTCGVAAGKLVAIARDYTGTGHSSKMPTFVILGFDPATGAVAWRLNPGPVVSGLLDTVLRAGHPRRYERWVGKMQRYVPLLVRAKAQGKSSYRMSLFDVHQGRRVWQGAPDKDLISVMPIALGGYTLFYNRSHGTMALFDGTKGAMVRALRGRHGQFLQFKPLYLGERSLWLWNRRGIQVLDSRTLKVRYTRGKWTPLEDVTAAQRKLFDPGTLAL